MWDNWVKCLNCHSLRMDCHDKGVISGEEDTGTTKIHEIHHSSSAVRVFANKMKKNKNL